MCPISPDLPLRSTAYTRLPIQIASARARAPPELGMVDHREGFRSLWSVDPLCVRHTARELGSRGQGGVSRGVDFEGAILLGLQGVWSCPGRSMAVLCANSGRSSIVHHLTGPLVAAIAARAASGMLGARGGSSRGVQLLHGAPGGGGEGGGRLHRVSNWMGKVPLL